MVSIFKQVSKKKSLFLTEGLWGFYFQKKMIKTICKDLFLFSFWCNESWYKVLQAPEKNSKTITWLFSTFFKKSSSYMSRGKNFEKYSCDLFWCSIWNTKIFFFYNVSFYNLSILTTCNEFIWFFFYSPRNCSCIFLSRIFYRGFFTENFLNPTILPSVISSGIALLFPQTIPEVPLDIFSLIPSTTIVQLLL